MRSKKDGLVDKQRTAIKFREMLIKHGFENANQFSLKVNMSPSMVTSWLRGESAPSFKSREKIKSLAGIDENEYMVMLPKVQSNANLKNQNIRVGSTYMDFVSKRKSICRSCRFSFHGEGGKVPYCDWIGEHDGKRRPCKGPLYSDFGECACYEPEAIKRPRKQVAIAAMR